MLHLQCEYRRSNVFVSLKKKKKKKEIRLTFLDHSSIFTGVVMASFLRLKQSRVKLI